MICNYFSGKEIQFQGYTFFPKYLKFETFEILQKQIEILAKLIKGNHDNLVLLTTKVLKLEKKIESLEGYANREI